MKPRFVRGIDYQGIDHDFKAFVIDDNGTPSVSSHGSKIEVHGYEDLRDNIINILNIFYQGGVGTKQELSRMSNEKLLEEFKIALQECIVGQRNPKLSDEYKAELLSRLEQGENLKCCSNCDNINTKECPYKYPSRGRYCDKWQSDGMTREERIK